MRILQLCQKPQLRGAEVFAVRLAQALSKRGHETSVAFLHMGPDSQMAPDATVLGGSEATSLDRVLPIRPGLLLKLRRLVREIRPEVIQLNGASSVKYGAFLRLAGVPGLRGARKPALVYRNIGRPQDWVQGAVKRFVYRRLVMPRMDAVAAVSEATLSEVRSFYGLRVPAVAIPTAVDPDALRPRKSRVEVRAETSTPQDAPVVIQVGSLSREKRPDRLLSVFETVRERIPNAHLWLLGDGPLREGLEASCSEDLARSVRFLGGREDVGSYLAAGDVCALVSDTEGLPAVLLEAGCLGLPVVATRVGGVAECVVDGETGLLVDPNHPNPNKCLAPAPAPASLAPLNLNKCLALALGDLLANPERRRSMGEAGRRRVLERFTFDSVAERFLDLYRSAQ